MHELEQARVDLTDLLRTIVADVAIEADARGCLVNLEAEDGLHVRGDAEVLRSAFENVIRNAVRYSPRDGVVAIGAQRTLEAERREHVEVTVRDEGPGVPEKDLDLIFEPFYRVDAAREHRSAGGEGLGLAIAARAIALHRGRIQAHNAPGGGLVVRTILPSHVQAPAAQPRAAPAAA